MIIIDEKKQILEIINEKRVEMYKLSSEYGMTSKEVIQCSQELDKILSTYQKLL